MSTNIVPTGLFAAAAMFVALAMIPSIAIAADPSRPDPDLTPGDVLTVDVAQVCQPGYSARVKYLPSSTRRAVLLAYGIPWERREQFELDHLIPTELGGSNNAKNLWPHAYAIVKGADMKTRLESRLQELVCTGKLPLKTAQNAIAGDWQKAFDQYMPKEKARQ